MFIAGLINTWWCSLNHVKDSGFWNPERFCLWYPEFWALESGIQLTESNQLMTAIQILKIIPRTKTGIHNLNLESIAWDPESKTTLNSLKWGEFLK